MGGRQFFSKSAVNAFIGAMFFLLPGFANADNEWLTWGHDPERTGSNPDEHTLSKNNVSQLEVKWIAQISTAPKDYILSDDGSRDRRGEYAAGPGGARFRGRQRQYGLRDRCGHRENRLAKSESERHQRAKTRRLSMPKFAKRHARDR